MTRKRKPSCSDVDANAKSAAHSWAMQHLDHDFGNIDLLMQAITHRSLPGPDYQRLEFLGDRVLGCIIAAWIYQRYPAEPEGKLSKRFSELVRKETCAAVARMCDMASIARLESNAANARLQHSDNFLGDICESLIGALYCDGGMAAAEHFVRRRWHILIEGAFSPVPLDAKSALQEWAQARGLPLPSYVLVARSGPDHAPVFEISASVVGFAAIIGTGTAKAEAEKNAAAKLLIEVTR